LSHLHDFSKLGDLGKLGDLTDLCPFVRILNQGTRDVDGPKDIDQSAHVNQAIIKSRDVRR